MRLLFVSTHTDQATGYAKVAYNLLSHLQAIPDLKIFHFGFQRHQTFRRPKLSITQYDAQANEEPKEQGFGFNVFKDYLDLTSPDAIFIYNDTVIGNKFLELIPKDHPAKIYVYIDQVYEHTQLGEIPARAHKIFVFSKSWSLNIPNEHVLLHAPDPSVFKLPPEPIDEFKTKFNLHNKQIFLNINRNSSRKRLDLTIQAFKHYHDKHPNSHLILITTREGFYNIPVIAQVEQLPTDSITFVPSPITDEQINLFYNIADYGINTADGEGYGLSTLEHAFLNKPQIVINLGAFRDFLDPKSNLLIPPTLRTYLQASPHGFYGYTTAPQHIAQEMEKLPTLTPPAITNTWEQSAQLLYDVLKTDSLSTEHNTASRDENS